MYGYSSSSHGSSSRANEIRLRDKDHPLDTVSCLIWDSYKSDPCFFASSWDGFVRYYVVKPGTGNSGPGGEVEKVWSMFLQHPVLCCDINENNIMFAGLATGDIAAITLENSQVARVGAHEAPICGLYWLREKNCLLSLGYDNLVRFWTLEGSSTPQMEVKLPLKTHTASLDYPYLLIGSAESTVAVVNLRNLPNCKFPTQPSDYMKVSLDKFSKFNCSRIVGGDAKRIAVGTIDGRCANVSFAEHGDSITLKDNPLISRSQKKTDSRVSLYGQVDCLDIGIYNFEVFSLIGGSEDLSSYNIIKKNKGNTYSSSSNSTGAATAVRLSPKLDYLVYATGTDWTRGIHELESIRKPRIGLVKLSASDLRELTNK